MPGNAPTGPKRSRLPLILGIVGALVVVLGGGGIAYVLWQKSHGAGTAASIAAWKSGGGETLRWTIFDEIGAGVSSADPRTSADKRRSVCTQLQSDVATAQAYLRLPDRAAQSDWERALSDLTSAARDCLQGVDRNDASLSSQATGEMIQGQGLLLDLDVRLRQSGGV